MQILKLSALLILLLASPLKAQESRSAPSEPLPADVQKVLNEVADLDLLKALTPLKLTEEQRKKLLAAMQTAADANASRRKEDYEAWRALAAEVAKAREAALQGTPLPEEVEKKIVKTIGDSEKRFQDAKKTFTNQVFAVAREVLTAPQKEEAERQATVMLGNKRLVPREYQKNPEKAPREVVQDLMLQVYVERILLYERTMDLIRKMK